VHAKILCPSPVTLRLALARFHGGLMMAVIPQWRCFVLTFLPYQIRIDAFSAPKHLKINMATLRRLDAFVKPREDLRTRSALGGLITVVAASAAAILFLSQIYLYIAGATRHSLHLSESSSVPVPPLDRAHLQKRGKIPLYVHVTFPLVQCRILEITLDGASMRGGQLDKVQGHHAIRTRMPTEAELTTALGKAAEKNPTDGCTIQGTLHIPQVGGTFSITVSKQAWAEVNAFTLFRVHNPVDGSEYKMYNVRWENTEFSFALCVMSKAPILPCSLPCPILQPPCP